MDAPAALKRKAGPFVMIEFRRAIEIDEVPRSKRGMAARRRFGGLRSEPATVSVLVVGPGRNGMPPIAA